ncbi:MAG: hypothetical protein RJA25_2441, partial [Bacteroidota bacterium]
EWASAWRTPDESGLNISRVMRTNFGDTTAKIFREHSDSLVLYYVYGERFVEMLDGMFSIAIVDTRDKLRIMLASDPSGIKSLYYNWDDNGKLLKFASEIPALMKFGGISNELRPQGIDDYLTGKSIWGNETIYRSIHTLPPATILTAYYQQAPKIQKYQSKIIDDSFHNNVEDAGLYLHNIIDKEVSSLMCADVDVCVVTSGGLDSSYITALAAKKNSKLHSFNIWYEGDWPHDERHYAREVAEKYNTTHHQIIIKQNQLIDYTYKMVKSLGQPNSAPHSLSTYALFEAVSKQGFKVALTGEGADEYFAGYKRFSTAVSNTSEIWLSSYLDQLSAIKKQTRNELYSNDYLHYLNGSTSIYDKASNKINADEISYKDRLHALLEYDQLERFPYYILRRVDHLSSAHAVEVRVPFCQPQIVDFSRKIPNKFKIYQDNGKYILYKAASDMLPQSIIKRPKQPFMLPIASMLKKGHPLFNLILDTLSSHSFRSRNLFKNNIINELIEKQLTYPNDENAEALWALLILELWFQESNIQLKI